MALRPLPDTPARPITDELHGQSITDPYWWLEDGDDRTVRAWTAAHNERTAAALRDQPRRARLRDRLITLLRAGSSVGGAVAGGVVLSLDRWGPHDQAVLMVRSAHAPGKGRVLVDPAELLHDATAAIDWYHPSPDGRLVAFGVSTSGDERSELRIVEVESGTLLADRIPNTRAASVAWLPDGSAFAYTRNPEPGTVPDDDLDYWRTVWWHRLGEDWHGDDEVWSDLPDKAAWPNVSLSLDGHWLLIHLSLGWRRVDVFLVDRRTGSRTAMIEGHEATSSFTVVGDRLIGLTTLDAPRGRIVSAPLRSAWHDNWETIVAESDVVLDTFTVTSRSLLVLSQIAGVAHLDRHDLDGSNGQPVPLPGAGSLAGLSGSRLRDEAFLSFTSFATPPSLSKLTPSGIEDWSRLWVLDPVDGPHGEYVVERHLYPSPDGTVVPLLLVRAAATLPTPDTPCILTGYGGFAITMVPTYSAAVVAWCDLGGIYAIAGIRGGSEYGDDWHRGGMREHKQQSFDDFLAATDWLVATERTSRSRLALRGGSNGGLLVGAAITQRPDVCRAVHCSVPLLDMLRYHRFLIARLWIPEFGDPDVAEEFGWLADYSPYHHVEEGICYPATLLTAADHDSRVDPMHARKMAARLAAATSCGEERPILLQVAPKAGHGQGKPVRDQVDELSDVLTFLAWQLDVDVPPPLRP